MPGGVHLHRRLTDPGGAVGDIRPDAQVPTVRDHRPLTADRPFRTVSHMITVEFHLDVSGTTDPTWFADSPELPSFYATAATLIDCRRVAFDVLRAAGVQTAHVAYGLSGAEC
jgi:hypothetical protein